MTFGVIEIASFQAMEDFHKDFVTKLSETIASTVDSAKTNDRTRKLLAKSQEAEQAIAAQEEEIRQNMEEMVATQAEMERTQRNLTHEKNKLVEEYEARIAVLESQLKTN